MRTTVEIDNDVFQAVKEIARKDRISAGRVISELVRRGLKYQPHQRSTSKKRLPTLPSRGEVITNEHIDNIRDIEGI